ncbi:hypothetical protein LT493_02025 [Streptomyces tricolor]|nr:hypothetical protein [Streptomyces tricolor]
MPTTSPPSPIGPPSPTTSRPTQPAASRPSRPSPAHPRPPTVARPRELRAVQCALYRFRIHRHLGDVDTALAHASRPRAARLPIAERSARIATDTTRALLGAGDAAGVFARPCRASSSSPGPASGLPAHAGAGRSPQWQVFTGHSSER